MAGRFEGLSDIEWKLFEDIFSQQPEKEVKVCLTLPYDMYNHTLLYILITLSV
jgi:hypothetical protein